ncbi:MAG: ABC transporter permease [Candidatus Gastranaerophilales bacterium]|nr:ABC transporter permease [Candidatus Gastranaerophilales bacterium]
MIKFFKKDKLGALSFFVLVFLYLAILFASFLSPYEKNYSNRKLSYAPPSNIYMITPEGKISAPYTYNWVRKFNPHTLNLDFSEDRSQRHYLKFFGEGFEYKLFGIFKTKRHFITTDTNGGLHFLGCDINGRDNFSRLLYGGRISLTIGFLALLISFPIGLIYGGISGYFGGVIDNILMRISEAVMSIPTFYLLIILAAILPSNMTSQERFALITIILAFIGWAGFARVVRGMVLSIKNEDYVKAAKSIGQTDFKIILRHILPQTSSYVIIAIALSIPSFILAESGLSFLGLGIQQPDASWGNMLKEAQEFANIMYRPWLLAPGFLIFIAVLSYNIIGDTIRDVLDPKSKTC